MRRPLRLAVLLLLGASPLAAQTGRLDGVVFDSLGMRPLPGALVTVMSLATDAQRLVTATTDAAGRYRVDSLAPGRYAVGLSTGYLDSLDLQLPGVEIALAAGQRARVDLATPSRATLGAAACPGVPLPRGRGAIVGQVLDADGERPLDSAIVAVSWSELTLDRATLRAANEEHTAAVPTNAYGQYRACGVPSESWVVLQVQRNGRAGAPVRVVVPDAGGLLVQRLSVSRAATRAFAESDSAGAPSDSALRLTGTASLGGTVRGGDGQPLAEALVRVADAAGAARTDAAGRFLLTALPAGSQMLQVRRVGYLVAEQVVELRAGQTATSDVRMTRIVTLDSVKIVALRTRIREFESRSQRAMGAGTIVTEEQIAKMNASETSDIVRRQAGFRVTGFGLDAKVESTRGKVSMLLECAPNVVIDGIQHQEINLVRPEDIVGIEFYRGGAGAPLQYDATCGAILIWTKR